MHKLTKDCSAWVSDSPVTSEHHWVIRGKAPTAHSRQEALVMGLEAWGPGARSPRHTAREENSLSS